MWLEGTMSHMSITLDRLIYGNRHVAKLTLTVWGGRLFGQLMSTQLGLEQRTHKSAPCAAMSHSTAQCKMQGSLLLLFQMAYMCGFARVMCCHGVNN